MCDENSLFEKIYNEYQWALRRIAATFQIPSADIDDIIQETFLSFFQHYHLWQSTEHTKELLVKILKRKSIDCLRMHSRRDGISLDNIGNEENAKLLVALSASRPLDLLIRKEYINRIAEEITKLNPEWKQIIIWYFLEQRSISEICNMLDITAAVCYARIYRIRNYLKKVLHYDDS